MRSKKWLTALVALGLIAATGKVYAATSDAMTITVTLGGTLDIDLDFGGAGTYDFGNPGVGVSTQTPSAIVVRNTSTSQTEDWQLNASTFTANWNITTGAPGADQYRLYAMLNTTKPAIGGFTTTLDAVTAFQNMDGSNFAGDQNGNNVPASTSKNIWFKLDTPTSTSSSAQQTITVTAQAVVSTTF